MKISGKERIVTGIGLAAIAAIAAMIVWTYAEIENANRQRRQTSEIARGLTELSLVTVEYVLHRNERARVQWVAVSRRLDRDVASVDFRAPAPEEILTALRERRSVVGPRLFVEITAEGDAIGANAPSDETNRRFEALLLSQLLAYQQENLADAFRLINLATDHIVEAQRRAMAVTVAGLALIASIIVGASLFLRRGVLAPLAELQRATGRVAEGDWDSILDTHRGDEIGELSRHFDAMTQSLRASFSEVGRSNLDLAVVNEELEAFSYSVSHDLRAPLRSMDGFSLLLLEDYGDKLDEDGKDALARIRAASQRMGRLIDDLLRLSQVTRANLKVTRVDLSAMARDIADSIDLEHPERSVTWTIEPGLRLQGDAALLRIAMQNLLQNAWKFTGRTERPVIRVGSMKRGAETVCFVADNGAGFDMANATGLFGAFQRLHHVSDFPGSGIGLAIVQRIVRRHEGEVWAEAKVGEGATFFFRVKDRGKEPHEQDHPAG